MRILNSERSRVHRPEMDVIKVLPKILEASSELNP